MSSTREIVTFQFGHYANYIGAHWWNIQESEFNYDPTAVSSDINHDVLYREGVDFKGNTTFTPRLLLVDLEGSLKHLPEHGNLYESASAASDQASIVDQIKVNIAWDESNVEMIEKEATPKPEYQADIDNPDVDMSEKEYNLSENVQTWTDFLYARYHPRTINLIRDYTHSTEKDSFDTFSNGNRLWEAEQFKYDFADKIRQYVEESDNCQGFQTIFDCANGFGGLSTKCMEHLNDEYEKTIFAVPVFAPKSVLFENADEPMTESIRVANIALAYSNIIEQTSLILPLSTKERAWRQLGQPRQFPLLVYKEENAYQTSAILASYLETLTLRYRMKDAGCYLPGFCGDMTNYGRKLAAAAMAFPLPMQSDQDLIDCLDKLEGKLLTQLSPNSNIGTDYVIQSTCIRGIPQNRLKRPLQSAKDQMKMAAYRCSSVSEMFQLYFQCSNHASLAHVMSMPTPQPTRMPFPTEIFNDLLNSEGFLTNSSRAKDERISSVPTIASIQSSGDLSDTLESLHREASRIKIKKLHRFKETGLEEDDYVEALESLLQFKDNYEDNFEL